MDYYYQKISKHAKWTIADYDWYLVCSNVLVVVVVIVLFRSLSRWCIVRN
jgi:hypothetical protein